MYDNIFIISIQYENPIKKPLLLTNSIEIKYYLTNNSHVKVQKECMSCI